MLTFYCTELYIFIHYSFKPLPPFCKFDFFWNAFWETFFFSASRRFCMTFREWSLFILHSNSNSQLFVTSSTSANWTSSRVSFTSRYTPALEIKASRYERIDLLLSSMHSSDENLLLSFTQEAGVSWEIMASLNWNNSKMSYLFEISRIKHGPNTHSAFRSTIRPDNWNEDLSWHASNINTNAFLATLSEQSLANRQRTSFW